MTAFIGRREFITLLGGAAAAWPLAVRAQQPKLPTIGFLGGDTPSGASQWTAAFVQGLRELGWIEGHTVAIEYRWAEGRAERYTEIATEFVRLKVDVIVTYATAPVIATKQATSVIPIVSALMGDRLALALSSVWRDRAATSPVCRPSRPILLPSDSNFYARLSPVFAGWRSWPISTVPLLCRCCVRFRQWPTHSASRAPWSKSGEPKISRPPSRRSRVAWTRFMSRSTRS